MIKRSRNKIIGNMVVRDPSANCSACSTKSWISSVLPARSAHHIRLWPTPPDAALHLNGCTASNKKLGHVQVNIRYRSKQCCWTHLVPDVRVDAPIGEEDSRRLVSPKPRSEEEGCTAKSRPVCWRRYEEPLTIA